MFGGREGRKYSFFLASFLLLHVVFVAAQSKKGAWKTLSGNAPAIIAKGGFSGLFPDSSIRAYQTLQFVSSPDTAVWCDVHLTKDSIGLCLPDLLLDNCTDITKVYPGGKITYLVNGVQTSGWFLVDYNISQLVNVTLIQSVLSRTPIFDHYSHILPAEFVANTFNKTAFWLNVQHSDFYSQHKLNMTDFVISFSRKYSISYISSPEVNFLRGIARNIGNRTKLIFRFLDETIMEPSTNRTYGSLLQNFTFIKTFSSGILVSKNLISPVSSDNYLQPYTPIVTDAHTAGLEIYAENFANDFMLSFNYSYDPLSEYLNFVDNGIFSVDGVVSDFPVTPSEAIGCFSHLNKTKRPSGRPIVISHNGASGDYPDCTDLAYKLAVDVGTDIIDCPVQVTKDGTLICMSSINLMNTTNVLHTSLSGTISTIPELQAGPGIYTFNVTWDDIRRKLKPAISMAYPGFPRNPRYQNAGNFMSLTDFLAFARGKNISGISLIIENAPFMATRLNYNMIDAVISSLKQNGYDNQTDLSVSIQSPDSSVLVKFKQETKYNLTYTILNDISDISPSALADIKSFAGAIAVDKKSVYAQSHYFTTNTTNVVSRAHDSGLSVYVYLLQNEFFSQPYDFFSDPTVEINAYFKGADVDGVITEFPATATRYKINSCLNLGNHTPNFMNPTEAGSLRTLIPSFAQLPAMAPLPVLNLSDVVEPPFPSLGGDGTDSSAHPPAKSPAKSPTKSGSKRTTASFLVLFATLLAYLLISLPIFQS